MISKKNEVYAKVKCEKHFAMELSEYFTFFVPGYQFDPAFRNRIWDGKIRLFNRQTNEIYIGLIPYVKEFAEERGYSLEYEEMEDEFSVYQANKFFDSLKLHLHTLYSISPDLLLYPPEISSSFIVSIKLRGAHLVSSSILILLKMLFKSI